ncbi:MAG: alpha/beta hydrolase [Candidatus Aminicenantales bacterium]
MRSKIDRLLLAALAAIVLSAPAATKGGMVMTDIEKKTCLAPDGVTIVYSAAGSGEPALLFIHGGLAERSFWDAQLRAFAGSHRTIALDLPGHGESGSNRKTWGMAEFGADVRAVVEAEELNKVVLIGNSLGGPVAIEAALLLPGKAGGVIGVDTFQSLDYKITSDEARQRAEDFRRDYSGSVKQMVRSLFHADADPAVVADAEKRMAHTPPEAAYAMFMSMAGYDVAASTSKLSVPLRAINGDLYPTDVPGVRRIKADFEVVVLPHIGHYPMLECPEEFNRRLAEVVAGLSEPAP